MANWDKLNRDFEATLESLTDEQFASWKGQRELKKKMRRAELEMSAKIQEQKNKITLLLEDKQRIPLLERLSRRIHEMFCSSS